MDELTKVFHIDVKLLIAQAVNFSIVILVLYKFAYKPLLKAMNERAGVIEKGLEDAKEAAKHLEDAGKEREERITEAKKEARVILEEARKMADKNKEEMVGKAKEETQKVVLEAKNQIMMEKEKMLREVKQEIGQLVVLATEKVLQNSRNEDLDKALIDAAIKEVQNLK
jgi:F-type H+-transporting ATPase subunit b